MTMEWPSNETISRVELLIQACAGPMTQLVRPTPLAGALQIATLQALKIHKKHPQREEELTSLLLGACVISAQWVQQHLGPGLPTHGLDWGQYDKYGANPDSEGSTGADFALLITFSENFARASVFQAKVSDSVTDVKIHRIAPFRTTNVITGQAMWPEPQTLRLVEYGLKTITSNNEADLDWIHYCAYAPGSFFCFPLSQALGLIAGYRGTKARADKVLKQLHEDNSAAAGISKLLKDEAEKLYSAHGRDRVFKNVHSLELIHLLAGGASIKPNMKAPGWLNLEGADAIDNFRNTFSQDVQVVELSGLSPTGPSAEADIVSHLDQALAQYSPAMDFNPASKPNLGKPSRP